MENRIEGDEERTNERHSRTERTRCLVVLFAAGSRERGAKGLVAQEYLIKPECFFFFLSQFFFTHRFLAI